MTPFVASHLAASARPRISLSMIPLLDAASVADLPELIGTAERVLFVVGDREAAPSADELAARAVECGALAVVRLQPELIDPNALWFRLMAAPKLRRFGLPDDRVVCGFYVFEFAQLKDWQPLPRRAGPWAELVAAAPD